VLLEVLTILLSPTYIWTKWSGHEVSFCIEHFKLSD
jgi:hypothetical protein